MIAWLAAIATIAGASGLYASATHQALFAGHLTHRRIWKWAGMGLLALALILLLMLQGPATAVFTWTTGMMLVWTIVPVAARWSRFRGEAK